MIKLLISGSDPKSLLAQITPLGDAAVVFESAVIQWLRERDYSVSKNGEWETPSALAKRLGISTRQLCRRRKHPRAPQHGCEYAPGSLGKRVHMISSNPALEQFLLANIPAADAAPTK